ncbi:MAG TPA: WG repeat-containing protein [Cyclobacteriaceae bacterium]
MNRILIFLCFFSLQGLAQSGTGKQLLSRIKEEKWDKAEQGITKALEKDSSNSETKYIASLLFSSPRYPGYNIDSAHHFILSATRNFTLLPEKERVKMKELGVDSSVLMSQKGKTDSLAFQQAKSVNTEESYNHFLDHYSPTSQTDLAIPLRDEAAFAAAVKMNTPKSYNDFLTNYPNATKATEAQKRYDQLIFTESTKDGRLRSYIDFVKQYPSNSFRVNAEQQIFEISTASGSTDSIVNFIKQYPDSKWANRANNLLYYLHDNYRNTYHELITDSLSQIIELNKSYWVPFLKSGRYGFMNAAGVEKITPTYEDIHPDYLCGDIRTDYLITSKGIISRNEKFIFEGEVKEVKDLNDGFLWITHSSGSVLLHKSGFSLNSEGAKEARLLAGRFILIHKESGWGILAFAGRELLSCAYEEISSFDDWIILTKNGKKIVVTADQVGALADKVALPQSLVFDDVRRWEDGLCWVRNDALEGVINESLEFIIPLDRQVLSKTPFGFLRKKGNEFFIEGITELENTSYEKIVVQGQWMFTQQKSNRIQLYTSQSGEKITERADSIWFEKNIALVKSKDSVRAWLKSNLHLDFNLMAKATLFGKDSSAWIFVDEKGKKAVYDALSGKRLFIADFEKIESPLPGYFLITKSNKKGIIDEKGKVILAIEYDAIIQPEPGRFSLLKDKKFGLLDLTTRQLIKPAYERNIVQYNKTWFTAFKEGGWGFIQADNKPFGKFQFNEILYWNDSVAWVKENFQWKLMNFKTGQIVQDKIKDFNYVKKYPHEHVAIIHHDNYYGVISNRHGTIIPSTFTGIINLGDADTPLYFTEKHVEEADIYVVIYYNHNGKLLRKQAFEAEEYERIFCEEN